MDLERRGMTERIPDAHWNAIRAACDDIRTFPARATLSRQAEPLDRSLLLLDGMMSRHVPGPHRDVREMVAIEVPGDFVDLHSFPLGTLDHDVSTLTEVRVAMFPHANLRRLMQDHPEAGIALWSMTVTDAAIHRYWSFRIGALRAMGRVANFLAEMELRLRLAGLVEDGRFDLPLTQVDLGEACGMTAAHVNRTVRELREDGAATLRGGTVTIHDRDRLHRIGQFQPTFLMVET